VRPTSFWEVDLGAGWLGSLTGDGEHGVAGEIGLAFGNAAARLGGRYVQGAFDASDYRAALLGVALGFGAAPEYARGGGCPGFEVGSRTTIPFAIGVHAILSGWGRGELDYLAPGLAIELPYYVRYPVDLVVRWDTMTYPGVGRDSQTHQTGLLGARVAIPVAGAGRIHHLQVQAQAGYALVTGTRPRDVGSGAVADVGVGFALLTAREGLFVRLHGRLGFAGDSRELATLFVSIGGEMKNAASRWYTHARRR
jgi:hypothetical protein